MQCLTGIFLLCFILFGYSQSQCEVLGTERKDASDIHHCLQMYRIFEDALLSNEVNLYTLQEVFFSSQHPSPSMLTVNYRLESPDTEINNLSLPVIWSRSSLLTYVNPFLFVVCEPAIAVILFYTVNIQLFPMDIDLSLSLNLSTIPKDVSPKQFVYTLSTMTARIWAYAEAQDKLSSGWDGSNKGYTLSSDTDITEPSILLVFSTLFLLFFTLILTFLVVKKGHNGLVSIEKRYYTLAVFYSVGIVTFGCNILELITSIGFLHILINTKVKSSSVISWLAAIKGLYIVISLIVMTVNAVLGWKKANKFPRFSCCFCCCFTRSKVRQKIIHALIFLSVSNFIYLLVTSICPTFLLLFVYPIKVISLVSFLGTMLFCTVLALTSILSYDMITKHAMASKKAPSQVKSLLKLYAMRILQWMLYILPVFAIILLMLAYTKVFINTDYTGSNQILQVISSLSPSVGLAFLAHYGKKWLNFFHDKHSEELSSLIKTESTSEEEDIELKTVDDNKSTEQSDNEGDLEQCATNTGNDDESATLLGEQHVTVEIEDSNL